MLIGKVSEKTGLSRDTIRFYEKKGLIKVERTVSEWNNYKNYDSESLNRLLLIKKAKNFGFTLNEIAELLELFEMDKASCDVISLKIKEKLSDIDKKIKALKEMKKMILGKVNEAQQKCIPTEEESNCRTFSVD